jgi:hypothetical protein
MGGTAIGALVAAFLLASTARVAWRGALRLDPGAEGSARVAGFLAAFLVFAVGLFEALVTMGQFRLAVAVPLVGAAAWGAGRLVSTADSERGLADLGARGGAFVEELRGTLVPWVGGAIVLLLAPRAARGLATPPLAWDALTYHVFRAGVWVQTGALDTSAVPGAWSYNNAYPTAADGLWAWAMLPVRGDLLVPLASMAAWGALLPATYAAARGLGARRPAAAAAALFVAAMPAHATLLTTAYVDCIVSASVLLGLALVARAEDTWRGEGGEGDAAVGTQASATRSTGALALAVLPLALAAAAKTPMIPVLAVGLFVLAGAGRASLRGLALGLVLAAPLGLDALRKLVTVGSPIWPFPLRVAGVELLAGDPELLAFTRGERLSSADLAPDFLWQSLFWNPFPGALGESNSLGPGSLLVAGAGILAFAQARGGRARRAGWLALSAAAAVTAGFLHPDLAIYRGALASVAGRLLAIGPAALAVLAATIVVPAGLRRATGAPGPVKGLRSRSGGGVAEGTPSAPSRWGTLLGRDAAFPTGLLLVATLPVLVLLPPHGNIEAIAGDAARAGLVVGLVAALGVLALRKRRVERTMLAGVALLGGSLGLANVRGEARLQAWDAASTPPPLYDFHVLAAGGAFASPLWAWLDERPGLRVAVVPGLIPAHTGQEMYLYPLLGRHLQHRLVYVPTRADGSADRGGGVRPDVGVWLAGLVRGEIDAVVGLPGDSPELAWARARPDLFREQAEGKRGYGWLATVDRAAVVAVLAKGGAVTMSAGRGEQPASAVPAEVAGERAGPAGEGSGHDAAALGRGEDRMR